MLSRFYVLGRVHSVAAFARLLKQENPVFGYSQPVKFAHRTLQRTGNPSRGVNSPASILAGRGEKNGAGPGSTPGSYPIFVTVTAED